MNFNFEWKIKVPWGKLVLVRRGRPEGEPVLLVHGRQDSSSVFLPLLELMPDTYNYVAIDMPGNGLSDAFPQGLKLTRFHFLAAMEFAVKHLGWDKFIFMGHSMGCEQGLFFNSVHPNRITQMILLDAGPTLMRMQMDDPAEYMRSYYDLYYENYHKENFDRKHYTYKSALATLRRTRDLSEPQSATLLERNFHEIPEAMGGQNSKETERSTPARWYPNDERSLAELRDSAQEWYPEGAQILVEERVATNKANRLRLGYLSWDNRLKSLAPTNFGNDYYFELFKNIPPTLVVAASDGAKIIPNIPKWHEGAIELLKRLAREVKNYHQVNVEGSHDVHFSHPQRVVHYIVKFLEENSSKVLSKL